MTTDNSRADALTDEQIVQAGYMYTVEDDEPLFQFGRRELLVMVRELLTASPASQPAAAPIPKLHCQNRGDVCLAGNRDGVCCPDDSCDIDDGVRKDPRMAQLAPSPADERAAFNEAMADECPEFQRTTYTADDVYLNVRAVAWSMWLASAKHIRPDALYTMDQMREYAEAFHRTRIEARDASANETGAEGVLIERLKLLLSGDAAFCKTIVARSAIEQAIAILSRPPAQADARVGLTDARIARLRAAIEGECDGLNVDYHHAKAILAYLDDDRA